MRILSLRCDTCDFNYDQPTGHAKDVAICMQCSWRAKGVYSDHSAYHHYLDTHHEWTLTMGNRL